MTEFEMISLVIERRVELVSLMQWWASVSFAIVAGAQLFERNLTLRLVILIEGFYLFFTAAAMRLVNSIATQFEAAFADLAKIEHPSEQTMSMLSQFSSGSITLNQTLLSTVVFAVVLVTCAYPLWLLKASKNAL